VIEVEEGYTFDPYRPSQVHWFVYDRSFYLLPGAQATFWFGAPYFDGVEPGWPSLDYGHVSIMLFPGSLGGVPTGRGPLEIVKEGVQLVDYEISGTPMRSQVRLITLHNPTDEPIAFRCRGIQAPVWGGSPGSRSTPPSPPIKEMNLLILHDGQEGRIIAAGERHAAQGSLAPCGFVPDEGRQGQRGQRVVEVFVPEEISRLGLLEIYENFVVDLEAEQPTLKRKPE